MDIEILANDILSCKSRVETAMRVLLKGEKEDCMMELVRVWAALEHAVEIVEPEVPF